MKIKNIHLYKDTYSNFLDSQIIEFFSIYDREIIDPPVINTASFIFLFYESTRRYLFLPVIEATRS